MSRPWAHLRRKRGSAVVFLTVLFVSFAGMYGIAAEAVIRSAAENTVDAAFSCAARAVLAEYDRELFSRYEILGVELDQVQGEKDLLSMVKGSFAEAPMKRLSCEKAELDTSAFSLADPENLRDQITALMKYRIAGDLLFSDSGLLGGIERSVSSGDSLQERIRDGEASMDAAEEAQNQAGEEEGGVEDPVDFSSIRQVHRQLKQKQEQAKKEGPDLSEEDRVLRSHRVYDTLPSVIYKKNEVQAYEGNGGFSLAQAARGLADSVLITGYAGDYFSCHLSPLSETQFFHNEMEYILFGKRSDRENYKKTYHAIFALREALNAAYLLSDSSKKGEALALAELLTPGPWAVVTQYVILGAWGTLETVADMCSLEEGHGVPLVKTESSWRTSLSSLTQEAASEESVSGQKEGGLTYAQYVRILLMTVSEETRLLRMMDLMQINMKGTVREEFVLADHFCGFTLHAQAVKKSSSPFVGRSLFDVTQVHSYGSRQISERKEGAGSS